LLVACARAPDVAQGQYAGISTAAHVILDGADQGPVAPRDWPTEIAALQPLEVIAKADGLYIATSRMFVQEAGIFVPRAPKSFSPRSGGDPAYRELAPGLFEYRIEG
jgi:hypothetical protein